MALDFSALYDLKYSTSHFAVEATLTPSGGSAVDLIVVDRTKGAEVSQSAELNTIRPAADVRASAFLATGLTRDQLRRAVLSMNGKTWRVDDFEAVASPHGEDAGELRLILTASP